MNKFTKEFEKLSLKCLIIACFFTLVIGGSIGYLNKKYCSNPYKKICVVESCQTKINEKTSQYITKCKCSEYKMINNPCYKKD